MTAVITKATRRKRWQIVQPSVDR